MAVDPHFLNTRSPQGCRPAELMKLWQKLLLVLLVMLGASFLAGWLWRQAFDAALPSYLAGVVGGLSALPVWELLRWAERKRH